MSERQYRQRGYQDDARDRERSSSQGGTSGARPPRDPRDRPEGPKTPNLMASHEVSKCSRCGYMLTEAIGADSVCTRCGTALHSCVQCVSFDPGSTLECTQPIKVRVSPKDERNTCTLFEPRTSVERQTSTAKPASSRQAFDDLFNF